MKFVYWRWNDGNLSKLHKSNPGSDGHTYCGAVCTPNKAAGIDKVFGYKRPGKEPSERDLYLEVTLQPCIECFLLPQAVVIVEALPPEQQAEIKRKRSEIAQKAAAERKKRKESAAA